MIRIIALLLAVFAFAAPVRAAPPARPCPYMSIGWSQQYPPGKTITSVSYASDYQVLFVIFNSTVASAFSNVPLSVMQAFSQTQNPLSVYNSSVVRAYHPMLLADQTNCPLLNSAGSPPLWNY